MARRTSDEILNDLKSGKFSTAKEVSTKPNTVVKSSNNVSSSISNKKKTSDDLILDIENKYKPKPAKSIYEQYASAPDFQRFSSQGADIENPTFSEANRGIRIAGWTPFGKKINNKVTYSRDNVVSVAMDGGNNADAKYARMTNDEVNMYNYILAKKGDGDADKYLDTLDAELNKRSATDYANAAFKLADEDKVAGTALNLGMSFLTPAAYVKTASQSIKNKITGSNETVDPNSGAFGPVIIEQATREGLKEDTGAFGDFLIDTGLSMGQFLTKLPLGQAGALTIMGSGAAGQTAKDVLDRGGSQDQAMLSGTIAGAAEIVFEKLSIDQLKYFKANPTKNLQTFVYNILKGSFTEGSEEVLTDITNEIADRVIMSDLSNYELSVKDYTSQGMSQKDANKQAALDFAKQLGLSFAGGGLSGGVMSAGANVIGNYSAGKTMNETGAVQDVISEGLASAPETTAYKTAAQLKQKADSGKRIGNLELGTQYNANIDAINNENIARIKGQLQENGLNDSDIKTQMNIVEKAVTGETLSKTDFKRLNPVSAQALSELTSQPIENTASKQDNKTQFKAYEPINNTSAVLNNESVSVKGIDSVKNGEVVLKLNNGSTTSINDIEFNNPDNAVIYAQSADYGTNGAKAFVSSYDGSIPADTYKKAFNSFYYSGKTDLPYDMVNSAYGNMLSSEQRRIAYYTGINDAKTEIEIKQSQQTAQPVVNRTYGVVENEASVTMDKNAKDVLHTLGQKLNVSVVMEEDIPGANGYYQNGEIHISKNADNPALVVFSHEITHHIEDTAPTEWKRYRDYVVNYMKSEHTEKYNSIVEHTKALYKENSLSVDDDSIMNEIAANATEEFLTDTKAIEKIVKEDRNLAEKIADFINGFIDKIKDMFSNYAPSSQEGNLMRENVNALENARKLWLEALTDSKSSGNNQEIRYSMKKSLEEQLSDWMSGNMRADDYFYIGGTPDILMQFGANQLPVIMSQDVIVKITGDKHSISLDEIAKINQEISNPLMILKGSIGNSYVLVTELMDKSGQEVIAAIHLDKFQKRMRVNKIASIYGKNNIGNYIKSNISNENLVYYDKKRSTWFTNRGLQLPKLVQTTTSTNSISNSELNVNGQKKFSLKDASNIDVNNLTAENQKLKETNDLLKQQFEITGKHVPNPKYINNLATKILKEYSSNYDKTSFANNLNSLFDYISNSRLVVWDEVMEATSGMAKSILENSQKINTDLYNSYSDLRETLRTTGIKLSESAKQEVAYHYGSYEAFRKANFGRLKITDNGTELDSLWGELSGRYPELFDVNANNLEQPLLLTETLDSIKPYVENPFQMDMDSYSYDLAMRIYEEYFNIPDMKTFADKKARELIRTKLHYQNLIRDLRQSSKERYESKLNNLKNSEAAKRQNLLDRKNEQLLKQRARQKERIVESTQVRKERESVKKYKTRITKTAKELSSWLLHPTDAKHVPEILKRTVADFISYVDIQSGRLNKQGEVTAKNKRWQEVMREMKDIVKQVDTAQYSESIDDSYMDFFMDIDPDFVARVEEFVNGNDNVASVYQMDSTQLRELSYLMDILKRAITNANKLHANARYQTIAELGNETLTELKSRKDKKVHSQVITAVDNLINVEQLDSFSYFDSLGGSSKTVLKSLRGGLDKLIVNTNTAMEYMEKLQDGVNTKGWSGKNAELHTFQVTGGEIKLSTAQVMELYELNKREQARGHIYGGGIKIADTVGKVKNKTVRLNTYNPVKVSKSDVETIINTLTEEQRRIADGMQEFLNNQSADWGNEVSLMMYGYKKFTEKNYYPIKSDENFTNSTEPDRSANTLSSLKNLGQTKATVKKADNPLVIHDIYDTFTRHVSEMANYNAFVIPLSDAMKWYNYRVKVKSGDNVDYAGSVKQSIERVIGKDGKKYFINLLKDINGVHASSYGAEFLDKLMANAKISSVGMNLRVVLQQPTAYLRAASVMDSKYLLMGITKKPSVDKSLKHSPIALWKSWGFFDINTGRSMKSIITGERTLLENIREKSLWAAGKMDDVTWGTLWNAVEFETKSKNPDLKYGSEDFNKAVSERFSDIVDRTQVVDTVLHRSQFARSNNSLVKMTASFMSEPNKSYNLLRNSVLKVLDNKSPENIKSIYKVSVSFVATSVLTAMAAAISDAMRDDNKEKKWVVKYLESVQSNIIDNVNPLNLIPIIKDFISMMNGFSPSRMDMGGIYSLFLTGQEWLKYFEGESKKSFYAITSQSVKAISKTFGIPAGNLLREFESIYNTISPEGIEMKSEISSLKKTYETMAESIVKGNTSKYKEMESYLKNKGKTDEQIQTGLADYLKDNDPRIAEAAQARLSGNLSKSKGITLEMKAEGYNQDIVVKAINSYINKINKENKTTTETKTPKPTSTYMYSDLFTAIDGSNINNLVTIRDDMVDNGTEFKTIQAQVTKKYKDIYIDYITKGNTSAANNLQDTLVSYLGYEEATINKWVPGRSYKDLSTAVMDGDINKMVEIRDYYLEEGREISDIRAQVTRNIKHEYIRYYENGDIDTLYVLDELLIDYFGYDQSTIDKWLEHEE
jgi:hypothetical protein